MEKVIPVILAGGTGTRLWPLSRPSLPKQFLNLVNADESLLQSTVNRLEKLNISEPIFICNEEHRFLLAEQIRQLGIENPTILLEPIGKNTAPAISLAVNYLEKKQINGVLLILSADHHIAQQDEFDKSILQAIKVAQQNKLVVFGAVPDSPETGYGYIKKGNRLADSDAYLVNSFVEKPNLETAQQFLSDGSYLWNCGMFAFSISKITEELKKHSPEIHQVCKDAIAASEKDLSFVRINKEVFSKCTSQSIDYAVLEHAEDIAVVPLNAGWQDLGAWQQVWEISEKDSDNNAINGQAFLINSKNNLVIAKHKLVTGIGLDNLIIVEKDDAVLVCNKDNSQDIKQLTELLNKHKVEQVQQHSSAYRPWGEFSCIDEGDRYKVKKITVKPNEKLSTQMHHHRAEHWVVVSGVAKVTIGEQAFMLSENESTYIPAGQIHSLENPGMLPLEIIEVQSGSYLGEDDIIRFDDKYGRS